MGLFSKNKEKEGYTSISGNSFDFEEMTLMRHGICRFIIDKEKENILVED